MRRYTLRATLQSAAGGTGNGTALDCAGLEYIVFQIAGITTATVTWEVSIDGSNWVAVMATNQTSGAAATTATADGLYGMNCAGYAQLRARISAFTSGTITISALATGD